MKMPELLRGPRAAVLFAALILAIVALQCVEVPSSPVLPNWDTQLSIPLVDSTYRLSEAMKMNSDIVISGSEYVYSPALFAFDPVPIGSDLKLYPPFGAQSVRQVVGVMALDLPSPVTVNVSAGSLFGGSAPSGPVIQPPIPQTTFPPDGIPPLLGIEFVHFSSGVMGLSIHNALPIPITFPGGFALKNADGSGIVASFPSTTILPHETWNPPSSILNGVTMKKQMQFDAQFLSAGSGGGTVTYDPDSALIVSYSFNGIAADSAQATLFHPFSHTSITTPYIVDSLTLVQEATFNSGKLQISLNSNLDAASTVNVSIAELQTLSGTPLSFNVRLDGAAAFDTVLNMRDWKIAGVGGALTNSLQFAVTLTSDDFTAPTPVTVHASDNITASLTAIEAPFAIHRLAGVSRPLPVPVSQTVEIPLGSFPQRFSADSILADSISILLHINEPGHPVDLDLTLIGRDQNGAQVAALRVPDQRVQPDIDAVYEFPKAEMAQFLGSFVSHQGTKIDIVGTANVNPDPVYHTLPHQVAVLHDTSNLYLSLEVLFPLRAGVINGQIRDTIPIAGEATSGARVDKDLLTSVKQASVFFIVDNAIPVGVNLRMDFIGVNGDTVLTLPQVSQAQAITVAAGTPEAPSSTGTPIRVSVSTEDAQHFADAQKVIVTVGMNSNGQVSHFGPADYVHVRSYSNMVFNINPDKLKNK